MRVFRALLAALLAALLLTAVASPANARTGRCFGGASGPVCNVITGKVTDVNDGDTIDVRLAGSRRVVEVRLRSIQAMEMTHYNKRRRRGPCHSVDATIALEKMLRRSGNRVRLSTQNVDGRDRLGRLRRNVAIRRGGRWRDVGEILIAQGHALWMTSVDDTTWNVRYNRAQQEAAQRGRNLWNPVECGRGPQQDVPVEVLVKWEGWGDNLNGEWIKLRNTGSRTLQLGRWWVRDAMLRRFTFPRGTSVAPGATVTVYVGPGTRRPGVFYWNQPQTVFENPGDERNLGDGAYLFDPKGDLRAYMVYPCVVACADARQGAVEVDAHPRRPEAVTVRNVSSRAVDLHGARLSVRRGAGYDFGPDSVLRPGEAIAVVVEGDPSDDSHDRRYWGADGYVLPDRGGSISLTSFAGITLACDAWGDGSCDG